MSHSFDILSGSPATDEQAHAALSREDYWLARHAACDATTTLDSLVVEADGTVALGATQHLSRQLLLGVVAKPVPGEPKIPPSEIWRTVGDRRVRGRVSASTPAESQSALLAVIHG